MNDFSLEGITQKPYDKFIPGSNVIVFINHGVIQIDF